MKALKRTIPLFFGSMLILILSQCSEDKTLSFGETQTGFTVDSVYQANSDGFLSVQYSSGTNYGSIEGHIYSDVTKNPTTIIGTVSLVPGSAVVPVHNKNYWKVKSLTNGDVLISWIPIQ